MTYEDAVRYLYSFINFEGKPELMSGPGARNLDHFRAFLEALGNPHEQAPAILVAGTNGKGSVATMLAGMLSAAGHKTGLFTSPHLTTIRERFRLDGEMIPKSQFIRLTTTLRAAMERQGLNAEAPDKTGFRTAFELMTALAFLWFAEERADVMVLEVGLGGRLDTTNVVEPMLSIITQISYDHKAILGETLTEIAREKAGIMRKGAVVLVGPQEREAEQALSAAAEETGSLLLEVPAAPDGTTALGRAVPRQSFAWQDHVFLLPALGEFQRVNAAVALTAMDVLDRQGYPSTVVQREKGLASFTWPGRLQALEGGWAAGESGPLVILDCVHNVGGAEALAKVREDLFPGKPACFIASFSTGKEPYTVMERLLQPGDEMVVYLRPGPRGLTEAWWREHRPEGWPELAFLTSLDTWQEELPPGPDGEWPVIIFCGSVFFAGEVLQRYETREIDAL